MSFHSDIDNSSAGNVSRIDPSTLFQELAIERESTADESSSPQLSNQSDTALNIDFWRGLGFENVLRINEELYLSLPARTIAFRPISEQGREALTDLLKGFGVPPSLTLRQPHGRCSLFGVPNSKTIERIKAILPASVELLAPGDNLSLVGEDTQKNDLRVTHLSDLALLDIPEIVVPHPAANNFLRQFSLQGKAAAIEAQAQEAVPLLGNICLSGQTTIWYAPPNAGKTLAALRMTHDAITEGRIAAGDVYYFNADDNSRGLAQKLRIMDDLGAHTIAPGFSGFRNADLLNHLKQTADRNEARGTLVIIDTVKKFTSLMDKRQSSEFADACRRYALRGGTLLGLAHTAKNANPDGKLRYAGTTDILEDFDAAYLLSPVEGAGAPGERVVEFRALKRRGDNAELAAYSYSLEAGISYEELLLSVQPVDSDRVDDFKRVISERGDAPVIDAITSLISEGVNQKMVLAKAAAKRAAVSERAAIRVLETWSGTDATQAKWSFVVRARGAKVYELLPGPG